MLNSTPLNTLPVGGAVEPASATQGILTINGLCISEGAYSLTDIKDNAVSKISSYDIPQNHGKGFLSNFNRGRGISITVFITGTDNADFLKNLDAFRKACYTKNATLDWKRDGEIRSITVNCSSSPQKFDHYNINFLEVQVNFTCLDPFWTKAGNQSTSIFNQTASFKEEITNMGTAQSDVTAYVLFGATDSTEVKMKIGENEITVTHDFEDNDILKIDGARKRVYVGETRVDYSGIFPFMSPDTNFFDFTINGTFTCNVLVLNQKNYV